MPYQVKQNRTNPATQSGYETKATAHFNQHNMPEEIDGDDDFVSRVTFACRMGLAI